VWRPVTGQLTHWSWAMAAADLLAILLAGAWIEGRSRRLLLAGMGTALLAVALAVVFAPPGFARYRGSSGVATALIALASTELALRRQKIGVVLLAVLVCKVAVETAAGRPVLAWTLPKPVTLAAAVHAAGLLSGVGVALAARRNAA